MSDFRKTLNLQSGSELSVWWLTKSLQQPGMFIYKHMCLAPEEEKIFPILILHSYTEKLFL